MILRMINKDRKVSSYLFLEVFYLEDNYRVDSKALLKKIIIVFILIAVCVIGYFSYEHVRYGYTKFSPVVKAITKKDGVYLVTKNGDELQLSNSANDYAIKSLKIYKSKEEVSSFNKDFVNEKIPAIHRYIDSDLPALISFNKNGDVKLKVDYSHKSKFKDKTKKLKVKIQEDKIIVDSGFYKPVQDKIYYSPDSVCLYSDADRHTKLIVSKLQKGKSEIKIDMNFYHQYHADLKSLEYTLESYYYCLTFDSIGLKSTGPIDDSDNGGEVEDTATSTK